jgi:hypothetical protein
MNKVYTQAQNGQSAQNGAQPHHNGNGSTGALRTVADVAALLNLKPQKVSGALEYHGANPEGGATKDGFFIRENGTGYDRNGTFYTCKKVAELAGIAPDSYEPFADWKSHNAPQRPTNRAQNGTKPNGGAPKPKTDKGAPTETATYTYTDENGQTLFRVQRKKFADGSKTFPTSRPDGRGGWLYELGDVARVLYRLPDVLGADWVFLCEGEKAADALNAALQTSGDFGPYVATTNPHGAGKWRGEFNAALSGKTVCVLPDNDSAGDKHASAVLASLSGESENERAAFLCRADLPGLPEKGDVCEFLSAGGTVETLIQSVENSPQWEPTPEPEKAPRFDFQTLTQLKARPAPQWLIHRLLTVGGTSLLTAKHASFKSFFALDMALSIACDVPFQGFEVRAGKTIYIAAEGAAGLTKRALAWQAHHQCDAGENFIVLDVPLKIHEAQTRAEFIGAIGAIAPTLIILDTLARCAVGLDENNSGDMGIFADAVGELAKATGAHVLTVHHNNKGGEYRGSTALPAAVDTHLSIERKSEGETGVATLKTEKQKDFEELETLTFEARRVGIPDTGGESHSLVFEKTDTPTSDGPSLTSIENKVLAELCGAFGEEGATHSQWGNICQDVGISNRAFRYSKEKLARIGAVLCPEKGTRGAKFTPCPDWAKSGQRGNCPDGCPDESDAQNVPSESLQSIENQTLSHAWGNGAKSGQLGAKSGQLPLCPEPSESRGSRGNTPLGVAPSCPDSEDGAQPETRTPKNSEGAKRKNATADGEPYGNTPDANSEKAANFGTDETDDRRAAVLRGKTVVANVDSDGDLIEWAKENGRAVYIGRENKRRGLSASIWANRHPMRDETQRDTVCEAHAADVAANPELRAQIGGLCGKVLVCYCAPKRCHGDELARLANATDEDGAGVDEF